MPQKLLLLLIFVSFFLAYPLLVLAEGVTVSFKVGTTAFTVEGFTSPLAVVTIKQNNVVLGTTVADGSGVFSKTVSPDNPGLQSFSLYGQDSSGLFTDTVTLSLNLLPNLNTTYTNLLLPPTSAIVSSLPVSPGDYLVVSGSSYPGSLVSGVLSSGDSASTTADANGLYSLSIPITGSGGTYAYQLTTSSNSLLSQTSLSQSFAVTPTRQSSSTTTSSSPTHVSSSSSSSPLLPTPTIIPSPATLPNFLLPFIPSGYQSLIAEFLSQIVSQWINFTHLGTSTCDLNHNGNCDLIDLSILLYYIQPK